jgi:hypothetical protein
MTILPWALLIAGLFGIVATRLGWYDQGGLMRRFDWFNLYSLLEKSWLGGGVRRANYTICALLILLGLIALLGPTLTRS